MKTMFKAALLAATATIPVSAYAQNTGASDDAVEDDSNVIIVTARKMSENLQEVPSTIAVVSSDSIEDLALDSVADISRLTAGLTFDDSFGRDSNRPVIRGQANILGDSGVAVFIDGIYFSGSIGDYNVDNIERIEVVKGPQSALYGRNTYSGAINIISKGPADQLEGNITLDISENDRYEVTGGIRGPITDSISAAVSARFYDFGGEYTNLFDGEKVGDQSSYSFSGAFRFDNDGPFTASLRTYYNRTDDGQPAIFAQDTSANNCFTDNGALYGGGGRYFCGTIQPQPINTDYTRQFVNAGDVGLEAKTFNAAFRMDYEISDQVTLTSLTGYNYRREILNTDGDYSPTSFETAVFARFPAGAPIGFGPAGPIFPFGFVGTTVDFSFSNNSLTEDWSQELRLSYDGDRFDFLLGGYYFDQDSDSQDIRVVPADAAARAGASFGAAVANEQAICTANPNCGFVFPLFGPSTPNSRDLNSENIRNWAIFGSASFEITDRLTLGVEGRYASERVRQSTIDRDDGDPFPVPVAVSETFKKFSPRITLDYKFSPDNLIYADFGQGQKPGGFNGVTAINAGVPSYEEEEVDAFEIGTKNTFADGKLIFNAAAFYNDITGYQLTQNVQSAANAVSAIVNAGDARVVGLELELLARPNPNWTFTANYALADSKFTSGVDENQGVLNDVADDGLNNCSTGFQFPELGSCTNAKAVFGSIDGKRIPRAPVHQFFVDADYRMPIGAGDWEFFAGANVTMVSTSFAQVHNLAETGGSVVADARLGFENENFKIQAYVKNFTDEDAVAQIIRYADSSDNFRRSFIAGLRPGRRFGLILSAKY